jgi:hypothetical protein
VIKKAAVGRALKSAKRRGSNERINVRLFAFKKPLVTKMGQTNPLELQQTGSSCLGLHGYSTKTSSPYDLPVLRQKKPLFRF